MFVSRWRRTTRWEFWPTLPIYLPVIPVIIIAALRHRSLTVVIAVNPGMPSGGFVLDSKSAILRELDELLDRPRPARRPSRDAVAGRSAADNNMPPA